jgi:hypothetical protein
MPYGKGSKRAGTSSGGGPRAGKTFKERFSKEHLKSRYSQTTHDEFAAWETGKTSKAKRLSRKAGRMKNRLTRRGELNA